MAYTKDYYQILGISRDSDQRSIRSAYRRLARIYHPDTRAPDISQSEADLMMRDINEAYEVLENTTLRDAYDRWVDNGMQVDEDRLGFVVNLRFNIQGYPQELQAMEFIKDMFTKYIDSTETPITEDLYYTREGAGYRINFKIGQSADGKSFLARTYEVKIGDRWHNIDQEQGEIFQTLRQWRNLLEEVIYKGQYYELKEGYQGDYGDIDEAFTNLNLFLNSRSWLSTESALNTRRESDSIRKFEICNYVIRDEGQIRTSEQYFAHHRDEMPKTPRDPHRTQRIMWGDEGRITQEPRERIVFGAEINPQRIVFRDEVNGTRVENASPRIVFR